MGQPEGIIHQHSLIGGINNSAQQNPKQSKPLLAPWRGGGKSNALKSAGKYMGGVGGGYSGGSNHGALT